MRWDQPTSSQGRDFCGCRGDDSSPGLGLARLAGITTLIDLNAVPPPGIEGVEATLGAINAQKHLLRHFFGNRLVAHHPKKKMDDGPAILPRQVVEPRFVTRRDAQHDGSVARGVQTGRVSLGRGRPTVRLCRRACSHRRVVQDQGRHILWNPIRTEGCGKKELSGLEFRSTGESGGPPGRLPLVLPPGAQNRSRKGLLQQESRAHRRARPGSPVPPSPGIGHSAASPSGADRLYGGWIGLSSASAVGCGFRPARQATRVGRKAPLVLL